MPFTPDPQQGPTPGFKPDAPPQQQAPFRPDIQQDLSQDKIGSSWGSALPDWLKQGVGAFAALHGGMIKGATAGNVQSPISKQAEEDHPIASGIGQAGGATAATALATAGMGAAAPAMADTVAGRVATQGLVNGAYGTAQKPQGDDSVEARAKNGGIAALIGAGGQLGMEALGGLMNAGKYVGRNLARFTKPQAEAYTDRPEQVQQMKDMLENGRATPELQDQATDAIQNSRRNLRAQGLQRASNLRELFNGKQVEINPHEFLGFDPEIDASIMSKVPGESKHLNMPDTMQVDANEAQGWKQKLQDQANYRPGTVVDPTQEAKNAQAAQRATQLKQSLEDAGGDQVKDLNQQSQESTLLNKELRKALSSNKPLAYVSSQSPDRVATLGRAEQHGAGGLLDFGDSLGAAKKMVEPDHGSGIPTFTGKLAGRSLLKASDTAQKAARDPITLQAIMNLIRPQQ